MGSFIKKQVAGRKECSIFDWKGQAGSLTLPLSTFMCVRA